MGARSSERGWATLDIEAREPSSSIPRSEESPVVAGLETTARVALAALFLAPLLIDAGAWDDSYHTPKWVWIAWMSAIATACAAGVAVARGGLGAVFGVAREDHVPPPLGARAIGLALVAWGLVQAVSVAWADSPSLASERLSRVAAQLFAMFAALVVIPPTARARAVVVVAMGRALVVLGAVSAIWILQQDIVRAFWPERVRMISNLSDWRGYLAAGLGNTNHVGDLLALALIVALVEFGEARRRAVALAFGAACVVMAAALVVCYSVGSNLGLIVGAGTTVGLLLWREGPRVFRRRARWAWLFVAWGAMVAFYNVDVRANPHRPGILKNGFGSERWREGGPTRLVIWAGGLEMVREHPLRGVGAGNFTYVFPRMRSEWVDSREDLARYRGRWTNAAHNIVLQAWAETGAAGPAALLALFGAAFAAMVRGTRGEMDRGARLRRATIAGLIAASFAHGMMNFTLEHPTGLLTFFALVLAAMFEAERNPYRVEDHDGSEPGVAPSSQPRALTRNPFGVERGPNVDPGFGGAPGGRHGAVLGVSLLGISLAAGPALRAPMLAQREYRIARRALLPPSPDPRRAEAHLIGALRIRPQAEGIRSNYVTLLLETGRPLEALEQLEIVRRRLDSVELYEREFRAWSMLGRAEEAEAARAEYLRRAGPR